MPHSTLSAWPDGPRRPLTALGDPHQRRRAARRLIDVLQAGGCPPDRVFDCLLPEPLRVVSPQYWSPLPVAKRAAEWFRDVRVQSVVDIGSGVGKFCVATAILGECRLTGLEVRPFLVRSARTLARLFELNQRVRFVSGALGTVPTPQADAYYFFNPFGAYAFGADALTNGDGMFNAAQQAHSVTVAERLLRRVPIGTWVLTLNGFGGRMPEGYDVIRVDWTVPGALRLWRKTQSCTYLRRARPARRVPSIAT